jgi:ubiquinone/menaquinone biosynthesis C-methylase UbiE
MLLYDAIGKNYAQTRKSDLRIAKKLLEILSSSPASTIVDIGAGAGSYAHALAECGYHVFAIEPSVTMRNQAIAHPAIEWLDGYAENLPLPNQAVDAAIIMLAFHHFPDHLQALYETHRVVGNGQIVLFTYDPEMISGFWLTEYFPSFIKDVESTFLPIPQLLDAIQTVTGRVTNMIPFPLPHDLSDSFAAVGWARPELYLDSNIRNGISSFAKIDSSEMEHGLFNLREDLARGVWDQKYGHLRQQQQHDVGYCFVHCPAT